jgi:hypothetical protein
LALSLKKHSWEFVQQRRDFSVAERYNRFIFPVSLWGPHRLRINGYRDYSFGVEAIVV